MDNLRDLEIDKFKRIAVWKSVVNVWMNDSLWNDINPATEEKQDTIIANQFPADYFTQIVSWKVPWQKIMSAMWERLDIQNWSPWEDVWRWTAVQIPTPSILWEQMSVVSDDVADTDWWTWVRSVAIHYLDSAWAEQEEVVILNWTTAVDTVATDIMFINDFHTITVWSNWVAEWVINIFKKWATSTIYNMIEEWWNKSLVPNRMVPAWKTLVLKWWHCSEARDKRTVFRIRSTDHYWVIVPWVFLFKDTMYLRKNSSGELTLNVPVPELSIVKISAWGEQTDWEWSCGWWWVLIDNT